METCRVITIFLAFTLAVAFPDPVYNCTEFHCTKNGRIIGCSDIPDHLCCRGKSPNPWMMLAASQEEKCCDGTGKLYDPYYSVCVNETIRDRKENESECGLTNTFNTVTQKCCKKNSTYGRVYDKTGECCNETNLTDPDQGCCEGKVYDKRSQTCCPNSSTDIYELHNFTNGDCCLDTPYNPATDKCEGNRIVTKSNDELFACPFLNGSDVEYYDNKTQMCCYGSVYSKFHFICYKNRQAVEKQSRGDDQVCEIRRPGSQVEYRTFSSGPNNRRRCINGKLVELLEDQDLCPTIRGFITYNIREHLCCNNGKFHLNGVLDGKKCCSNSYAAYNPETQMCCYGKVSNVSENDGGKCCHYKAFDPRTHRCDSRNKVKKAICPDKNQPPYPERCNLTDGVIARLRKQLVKGGLNVYFATVSPDNMKTTRKGTKWSLVDVVQVAIKKSKERKNSRKKRSKGQKITLKSIESVTLNIKKCRCPSDLVQGERYIMFTEKPLKKGKQKKFGQKDVMIPLNNSAKLGKWLSILSAGVSE